MALSYICGCCKRKHTLPLKSMFGKEEAPEFCKDCMTEVTCHACGKKFIPCENPDVRVWRDDDGLVNRYSCCEDCFKQRQVTCHKCREMFPAEQAFELGGYLYCSEYCRDHLKCEWCHLEYDREGCFSDKFCSPNCQLQYYNITDDKRRRMLP
ncbi:MAG: hypothetical protein IJT54_04990 [Candidatus Methanomethylophilaceae archaeon]|nr:hypothetical protein [Candidatus Methanomethylophilaceae archaeon]